MKINKAVLREMILNGFSFEEIRKYVTSAYGEISRTRLAHAIEKIGVEIRKNAAVDHEFSRGETLLRLQDLYKRSMLISDYKTCLAVVKEKAQLLGLQIAQEDGNGEESDLEQALGLGQIIEKELGKLDPDGELTMPELLRMAGEKLKGTNEKPD